MKFYDRNLTKKDREINIIWILLIFIIGFIAGCFTIYMINQNTVAKLEETIEEKQKKINEQYIEIDSLRETIYIYRVYGK